MVSLRFFLYLWIALCCPPPVACFLPRRQIHAELTTTPQRLLPEKTHHCLSCRSAGCFVLHRRMRPFRTFLSRSSRRLSGSFFSAPAAPVTPAQSLLSGGSGGQGGETTSVTRRLSDQLGLSGVPAISSGLQLRKMSSASGMNGRVNPFAYAARTLPGTNKTYYDLRGMHIPTHQSQPGPSESRV